MATSFGTLWDRQVITRVGDGLRGLTMAAIAHSLPATNPQVLFMQLRSVAVIADHTPPMMLLGQRGNASQNTVGYMIASTGSCPLIEYDAICAILHTLIA